MNDPLAPDGRAVAGGAVDRGDPAVTTSLPRTVREVVPILPNLFATMASFIVLMLCPWVCMNALHATVDEILADDRIATYFVLANLEEAVLNALAIALVFLVLGAILQTWRHQRPFPARRPIALTFPIAWAVLIPESLLHGGSGAAGGVIGTSIALAFAVHWGILIAASEALSD